MTLDGKARAFAGELPAMSKEELEYTAHVLAPHRDSGSFPIRFACQFGEEPARPVGCPPQGLSPYAGWELALDVALRQTGFPA